MTDYTSKVRRHIIKELGDMGDVYKRQHLMKGKTVIMIAHRLSRIRNVDEILVLADGNIAERGTDAALMATDTKYREYQTLYELSLIHI